ncbi:50S ribosomal protein L7/L12 [Candidatus Dependentiae bacterium]|nr:50S ribosomal protein L7/L12 [Candidatus Dependentiae bacterium]
MSSRIEILDAIKKMNVMELAELIKDIETEFGVSAAAPVAAVAAMPAAAGAAAPAEEKLEYKVTLKDAGANKINVIKALRSVTTLSLGDAKNGAENVPFVIAEAASKDDAHKIKKALEEVGAKVELS